MTARPSLVAALAALLASVVALALALAQDDLDPLLVTAILAATAAAGVTALLLGRGARPKSPDPLDDRAWLKLVEESVDVLDELDRHRGSFDEPRRALADHVILRITEILERCDVDVISSDGGFDARRHTAADHRAPAGAPIAETVSPGFAVGARVLRRAKVRLTDEQSSKLQERT